MKTLLAAAFGLGCLTGAANAADALQEESIARAEEVLILTGPIAGMENRRWFDYRINVSEAQKELTSDLRHASDIEDRRDAWEEYAQELRHERRHYIKEMAERGYRGTVTIED